MNSVLFTKFTGNTYIINYSSNSISKKAMINCSLEPAQPESPKHQLLSHKYGKQILQNKKLRREMEMPDIQKGHWSKRENMLYVMFLNYFEAKFSKKQNRRLWKFFKLMSEFIETRSPNQCRSHHQKMEKNYSSVSSIIKTYKMTMPNYDQRYSKLKNLLIEMNQENSILAVNQSFQIDQNENFEDIRKMKFQNIFGTEQSQNGSEVRGQGSEINGKQDSNLNKQIEISQNLQQEIVAQQKKSSVESGLNSKSRLERAIIKYKKCRQQKLLTQERRQKLLTQERQQKLAHKKAVPIKASPIKNQTILHNEQALRRVSKCQCKTRNNIILQGAEKNQLDKDNYKQETRKVKSAFKGVQQLPHSTNQMQVENPNQNQNPNPNKNLNFKSSNRTIDDQMENQMTTSMQEGMLNQFIQSMAYFQMLMQSMQSFLNFNQ